MRTGPKPFLLLLIASVVLNGQTFAFASRTLERRKSDAKPVRTHPIFVFHTDEFWLNLHHFLYVLGRAENKSRDSARDAVAGAPAEEETGLAKLNPKDRASWRVAVKWYAAGPSNKDLIFDDPLSAVTNSLARAGNAKTPVGVDAAYAAVLSGVAPVYRKAWWPGHQAANRTRETVLRALIKQYGRTILQFITKAYQMEWPAAGYPVHLSAWANWAGAYSTAGNLLVVSSLDESLKDEYGLETVFHEGMHQWDDQVQAILRKLASTGGKSVPRDLSHTLIFFTAGEAVRSVIPTHIPYAEKYGVWQRGWTGLKALLEEFWKPYLNGQGSRDEALAALINSVSPTR